MNQLDENVFHISPATVRAFYPYQIPKRVHGFGVLEEIVNSKYTFAEMNSTVQQLLVQKPFVSGAMKIEMVIRGIAGYELKLTFDNPEFSDQPINNPDFIEFAVEEPVGKTHLVYFVRERRSENARWTNGFIVENTHNPEINIRAAIEDFLSTEQGIKCIEYTNKDFNWGDAMAEIPSEIFAKHNVREINNELLLSMNRSDNVKFTIITVNQDEVLIPSSYFETE